MEVSESAVSRPVAASTEMGRRAFPACIKKLALDDEGGSEDAGKCATEAWVPPRVVAEECTGATERSVSPRAP